MKLDLSIDLGWPSYEDDIAQAVRDEVIAQVRLEVRKHSKQLRAEVEKQLTKDVKAVVDSAMLSVLRQ
jgi:D-ribose pyranose/furanose isomerase RbsD